MNRDLGLTCDGGVATDADFLVDPFLEGVTEAAFLVETLEEDLATDLGGVFVADQGGVLDDLVDR